ncbi:MAG: hypothetical protein ACREFB_20015 [Stellaceae bacterium]
MADEKGALRRLPGAQQPDQAAPPTCQGRGPIYRVHFKNRFARDGRVFMACQRSVDIRLAKSRERAIEAAKKRFARLEHITHWHLHASMIEVEITESEPGGVTRQDGAARPRRAGSDPKRRHPSR